MGRINKNEEKECVYPLNSLCEYARVSGEVTFLSAKEAAEGLQGFVINDKKQCDHQYEYLRSDISSSYRYHYEQQDIFYCTKCLEYKSKIEAHEKFREASRALLAAIEKELRIYRLLNWIDNAARETMTFWWNYRLRQ
ncbi:hypothetical protein EBB07_00855 [Paenibacillaceae bacterium]|nr:hypothetical protein EBB07_00855 [Paenibacillaceae bacterium]